MSLSLSLLAQRDYRESPTNYNLFCNLRCHIAKNILNSHDRVCRLDRFSHLVNKDFFTAYFFFTGFAAPRGKIVVTGSLAAGWRKTGRDGAPGMIRFTTDGVELYWHPLAVDVGIVKAVLVAGQADGVAC
jgi:hypothetical protein